MNLLVCRSPPQRKVVVWKWRQALPSTSLKSFEPYFSREYTLHQHVVYLLDLLTAEDAAVGGANAMPVQPLRCPAPVEEPEPDEEAALARRSGFPQLLGSQYHTLA
jgi:hypothetical protein